MLFLNRHQPSYKLHSKENTEVIAQVVGTKYVLSADVLSERMVVI